MTVMVNPSWSKPECILFATEVPVDMKAYAFAVEQARENKAHLILFHAYDTLVVAASETSGIRYYDYEAAARTESELLAPLAEQARNDGVSCDVVVHAGLPADRILTFLRENKIDRIVMGTHSRSPLGQILIGSVAEAIVRSAYVPVFVVGPHVADGQFRNYKTRTVLCAVNEEERSYSVAALATQIAQEHKARLILQHVIRPKDREHILAGRTLEQMERDLLLLIPQELRNSLQVESIVVPGEPADELLYQSKAQQADLIVMGAHHASILASVTRPGIVHKVLAQSHCPVLTVSSLVTERAGEKKRHHAKADEVFIGGVF